MAAFLKVFGVFMVAVLVMGIGWPLQTSASSEQNVKSGAVSAAASPDPNDDSLILLNSTQINVKSVDARTARKAVGAFSGRRMHLIRFTGPIKPEWQRMLTDRGLEIVDYIPNYTYLVYGDANTIASLQAVSMDAASPIEWDGIYQDEYRISPDVFARTKKSGSSALASDQFQVQLYKDPAVNAETIGLIDSIKTSPIKGKQEVLRYINLVVGLDSAGLAELASRPDVISIHGYSEPTKLDERQDIILAGNFTGNAPTPGDYLAYLAGKGFSQEQFDASNFAVDISDSGVDIGTPASPNQFVLRRLGDPAGASRYIYSRIEGTPTPGGTTQACDGHGNLNASIIMGYVPSGAPFNAFPHADASLFRYGLGVAPFVKLGSSVIFDPANFTHPDFTSIQSDAYHDGSRISSNSWGETTNTYNADAQTYDALVRDAEPKGSDFPADGNQEMVIVFAAGNNGTTGTNTVEAPGTAKNVITVGASENVQSFLGLADHCGIGDSGANSAFDIATFSSRGPTSDGRSKPDIVLPGTHVSGSVAQNTPSPVPVSGNGNMLNCFAATGVCAGPNNSLFWPLNQQWYTASSGTSHSTPAVAGLAALIRQDFINRSLQAPSPAMTKGVIMNSARYMTGTGANDTLPSNSQGMGLADLNNYFNIFSEPHIIRDQVDRFTSSGQERVFSGTVVDATKPLRVTVAWSDAPGSTTGDAFVNNLDLEVTVGGQTFLGNVFDGANSVTGGSADARNNVESVVVPAGVTGNFVVRVKATNIAGDGVPNNTDPLDQDFALVVSNANEAPESVVQIENVAVTAESGTPANNAPDPGETVTVDLALQEIGTANSGSVTATLQNSGGIVPITAVQNFGSINVSSAVARPFQFSVPAGAACGSSITLSFLIKDGTNAPFILTRTVRLGVLRSAAPVTFTNPAAIDILDGAFVPFPASVYPSNITVNGITTAAANYKITMTINGFSHTFPSDVNFLLVGPNGQKFEPMSNRGSGFPVSNITFTLDDDAPTALSFTQLQSGTFRPSVARVLSNFPPPAPVRPYGLASPQGRDTFASSFGSSDPNGTWSLYITDSFPDDTGSISGGWSLTITPVLNVCSTASSNSARKPRADFDGDGKTDVTVYGTTDGNWFSQ